MTPKLLSSITDLPTPPPLLSNPGLRRLRLGSAMFSNRVPGCPPRETQGFGQHVGDLVAFTDDDCRVSVEYVCDLLRHDAADGNDLVMRSGSVVLGDPRDLPLTIKPVAQAFRWKAPMPLENEAQLLGGALIGCNMAMRRDVLERIGFFDKNLGLAPLVMPGKIRIISTAHILLGLLLKWSLTCWWPTFTAG